MGAGRACDHALGHAAVRLRWRAVPAALLATVLLVGCQSVGAISGAAVGASTGAVTVNPIVGYVTAITVAAGIEELQHYIARVRQGAEQDVIVNAVGTMQPGETRQWKIVHDIPMFDDEHGEMRVVRSIDTPLAQCKEVLFTVDQGRAPHLRRTPFVTGACRDSNGWKWAEAEPATERWGYFQHIAQ